MQQAIPYKSWQPFIPLTNSITPSISMTTTSSNNKEAVLVRGSGGDAAAVVSKMVTENPVIVFAKRGCCMGHVVKRLLLVLGVNPCVYEVDEGDDNEEARVLKELEMINGSGDRKVQFPAVFIGGKFFGGLDRIMATHISGDLIPVLKEAKALWL